MSAKDNTNYLHLAAECAHHGLREVLDGNGRRRWFVTCASCGKEDSVFRSDVRNPQQVIGHFTRAKWVLGRKSVPYCSAECRRAANVPAKEIAKEWAMALPIKPSPPPVQTIGPNPVIMRRVITLLNDHFDMATRRYDSGYSDEKIAKDAETSPDFVTTFRRSAYGELAEDPMISRLRDDVTALKDLQAQEIAKLEQEIVAVRATFEAQNKEIDYKLARLIGAHSKAAG